MKKLLFVLLMLTGRACFAQTMDTNTRPGFELKLFVNDSTFYQATMQATHYVVLNKIIQVFPGEKLFIEADVAKDSLVNLRMVPVIVNKEKTITIAFEQAHEGKQHEQMILTISNPFGKYLTYKANMNLMKLKRWVETDVLPVAPHLLSKEMWSDVITTIAVSDLYLKDSIK
jgi:hypothetical protein